MDILVDFDGTCVAHDFPRVGAEIGAAPVLRDLVEAGHRLILFTMRGDGGGNQTGHSDEFPEVCPGDFLKDATDWFAKHGIQLYGINAHPTQHTWTNSPKAYGHLLIDDTALGVPLLKDPEVSPRPFVDWYAVRKYLEDMGLLREKMKVEKHFGS